MYPGWKPIANVNIPLITRLLQAAEDNQGLLHAILCVSSSFISLQLNRRSPSALELFHRGQAIQLLNQAIKDPEKSMSDDTVATIIVVAAHDVNITLTMSHFNVS